MTFLEYPPELWGVPYGGITTYLITAVKGYLRAGYRVELIIPDLTGKPGYSTGALKIHKLPWIKRRSKIAFLWNYIIFDFFVFLKVMEIKRKRKVLFVEVPDWRTPAFFLALFKPLPLLMKLHGPSFICMEFREKKAGILERIFLFKEKFTGRRVNLIIYPGIERWKRTKKAWKVPEGKGFFLEHPVDTELFSPQDKPVKKTLNCIYVGKMIHLKGIDVLLEAIEILKNEKIMFILVGPDPEGVMREYMKRKPKNVIYVKGPVIRERIPMFYRIADIAVVPSRPGGMEYTTLEAMAFGLPVVCTFPPGKNEVLEGVYMVPPEDPHALALAIKKLANSSRLRKKYAEEGRKY
ncbi:hypothetical protein DRQ16_04250, partial [bacterium]